MDGVQIYYLIILFIGYTGSLIMHGSPKEGEHNFFVDMIAFVLAIPIIGRVFGWW